MYFIEGGFQLQSTRTTKRRFIVLLLHSTGPFWLVNGLFHIFSPLIWFTVRDRIQLLFVSPGKLFIIIIFTYSLIVALNCELEFYQRIGHIISDSTFIDIPESDAVKLLFSKVSNSLDMVADYYSLFVLRLIYEYSLSHIADSQ